MSKELIAVASCPVHGELARIYAVQAGNEHVKHNVAEPPEMQSGKFCLHEGCAEIPEVKRV